MTRAMPLETSERKLLCGDPVRDGLRAIGWTGTGQGLAQDQGVSVSALAVVNPNGNVVLDFELRLGGMDSAKGVFATEKVVGTGKTELLGCAPAGWDEGKAEREMLILVRATVLDR